MTRFATRTLVLGIVALGLVAASARAQSGPDGSGAGANPAPNAPARLGPNNINAFLKGLNYQVEETKDTGNGFYSTRTTIKRDGWTYLVEVLLDTKGGSVWLISPLGNPIGEGNHSAGLFKLLESNHTLAPYFFSIRIGDRRICMNYEIPNLAVGDQAFSNMMTNFVGKIRSTHGVWNTAGWQNGGGTSAQSGGQSGNGQSGNGQSGGSQSSGMSQSGTGQASGGQGVNSVRPNNNGKGSKLFQPVQD